MIWTGDPKFHRPMPLPNRLIRSRPSPWLPVLFAASVVLIAVVVLRAVDWALAILWACR